MALLFSVLTLVTVLVPIAAIENGNLVNAKHWYVAITNKFDDRVMCNGALLSSTIALTSASCVAKPLLQTSLIVRLGSSDSEFVYLPVGRIIYHPTFFKNVMGSGEGDLAILVLDISPNTTAFFGLQSVYNATTDKTNIASPLHDYKFNKRRYKFQPTVHGSGFLQIETAFLPGTSVRGYYPDVFGPQACRDAYRDYIDEDTAYDKSKFLCSFQKNSSDASLPACCERDQGGPLFTLKQNANAGVRLHGLVSTPLCSGKPVFYTRLSTYRKWILNKLKQLTS